MGEGSAAHVAMEPPVVARGVFSLFTITFVFAWATFHCKFLKEKKSYSEISVTWRAVTRINFPFDCTGQIFFSQTPVVSQAATRTTRLSLGVSHLLMIRD